MEEVKHMPGILGQSKREIMEWYRTYMEDYNTATMPHPKYYNLEAWEMKEYQTQQELDRKKKKKRRYDNDYDFVSDGEDDGSRGFMNDEQRLIEEKKRRKEEEERKQFEDIKMKMMSDRIMREEMRDQEILRNELQVAYRQGDYETVKKLEKRLAPGHDGAGSGGMRRRNEDQWG